MKDENMIKKIIMMMTAAVAMVCVQAATTYTETVDGIEWTYTVTDGEASIGSGSSWSSAISSSTSGAITVPLTLGGCPVTSIGDYAFYDCSSLTSVTIPDSVTSIGDGAFEYCGSLESITIGNSVTSIGGEAFAGCNGLADSNGFVIVKGVLYDYFGDGGDVVIPNSVTSIGSRAFYWCDSLTSVTIGDSVTSIGDEAFSGCSGLADNNGFVIVKGVLYDYFGDGGDVVIPNVVTSIGDDAFYNCSSLTSVTIGDSVTSIGDDAFSGCSSLASLEIAHSVTNIGDSAFEDCYSLTGVTIPDGVTNIGDYAFSWCRSLASLQIPPSVTNIGDRAFENCRSLTSVTIPDSVTSIGDYAFSWCRSLASLEIPHSVTNIGDSVFDCCGSLRDIIVSEGNNKYKSIDGLLLSKDGKVLLVSPGAKESVLIPDGVMTIGNSAFSNGGISTSIIVDGGTNIVVEFFPSLKLVSIPDSVKSIGESAFKGCSFLESITIPNSVTNVGDFAFSGCSSLAGITIPDSVTSIGKRAFAYCNSMQDIIVDDDNKFYKSIDGLLFSKDGKVLVGCFPSRASVVVPDGVVCIADHAFEGCRSLASVTMPDSVTSIGNYAFSICDSLTSVTIPSNVTNIGYFAFQYCGALSSVTIQNGVGSIGDSAFFYCSSLTSVTIPSSVTNIGAYAFNWCESLTSITIPDSVTSIGDGVFCGCYSLASIVIPDRVEEIGDFSFAYCDSLTNVVVQSGVMQIVGEHVFEGSVPLDAIYVPVDCLLDYDGGFYDPKIVRYKPIMDISFDVNGGNLTVDKLERRFHSLYGSLPIPFRTGFVFEGWFFNGERVSDETVVSATDDHTLVAKWRIIVPNPVVASSSGMVFYDDFSTVSISCAIDGATIYYSDEGKTPKQNETYRYKGSFVITNTTTVKALAVFAGEKSEYVTVTIEKKVLTIEEALDGNVVGVNTGGAASWIPLFDKSAKEGGHCVKSGNVPHNSVSWMEANVLGAGTISFWCKTSCEHDDDGTFTWDRLMVFTNNIEITEWRMDGESGWTRRELSFEGGENVIRWCYFKDESDSVGGDCAWVDGLRWTRAGIPELSATATSAEVASALEGSMDAKLAENIKTAAEYAAYHTWALGIEGVTAQQVKESPNAWLSFALDADGLIAAVPKEGDVVIDAFESAATDGAFEFAVKIDGIAVGDNASAANIRKVFDIEGAEKLVSGRAGFSPDNVEVNAAAPENGNVKFTVTPKGGGEGARLPTSFFFRVKMK